MKLRELKQTKRNAPEVLEQVRGHQVSEMQRIFIVLCVLVLGFVVSALLVGGLGVPNALAQAFSACAVVLCLMMSFTQLNHWMADKLNHYHAQLKSIFADILNYLRQQMSIWLKLSSLEVNLPPAISRFGRLSETFQFTQIPVLHTPIQFRS